MNTLKPAMIAGIAGLGLSLLVALASGVRFPQLLIRPLVFGGIFFGLGVGVLYLYRRYLTSSGEYDGLGQNVDISLDDDEKIIIGEDGDTINLTGFEETDAQESGDFNGDETASGGGLSQNTQGLEQNSALGYTESGHDADESFKPMDFNILNQNTGRETPQPVVPSSARGQKAYARVPELESVMNTDPKKLARTIENLLSDE
ncbi:MAG: hypothetical protein LBK61_09680 [Spirochaetaceae bacterium]|jgi:hypothetical protein|nr:hypothetical protein [Spirochaetaceae bacterium]